MKMLPIKRTRAKRKKGISGQRSQTRHDNPLKASRPRRSRPCRFTFFPPLVRGIFRGAEVR